MAYRIPRGHEVNRPQYQELSEGVRPEISAVPQEAYTGLPPVRIDELSHDPIVLDAGTVVGVATGGLAEGKLFPAHAQTGTDTLTLNYHSDGASWGLLAAATTPTAAATTAGPVLPIGMVYQPIYSFQLQATYTNYKRNDNVGFVTDYLVQIPARSSAERDIRPGERVMINTSATAYGTITAGTAQMGTLQKWDDTVANEKYVIGRCFNRLNFADSSNAANLLYDSEFALGTTALTTAGAAEFKGLNRVQTVPGLGLAGSGTGGVPAWLMKAQSDATGLFYALTILVRL